MNVKELYKIFKTISKKYSLKEIEMADDINRFSMFQSYIVSKKMDESFIKEYIYQYSDYLDYLKNEDVKQFFINMKSKNILKIINSGLFPESYLFLIINNISKDKLIDIFDKDDRFIKYYVGNDQAILIRYCDLIDLDNRALFDNEAVLKYYIENRPEVLFYAKLNDDSIYLDYIIDILKNYPEKIKNYYGDNKKVILAIMQMIEYDYRNLMYIPDDNDSFKSEIFSDFVCKIIELNHDAIKYYSFCSKKVNEYIMDNNLHFSYDEIPICDNFYYKDKIRYSNDDFSYILYLIKYDIRFINQFYKINDDIYNYVYSLLEEDINNIIVFSINTFSNICNYSDDIVVNYLFPLLKNDISLCNIILPYIMDYDEVYNYIKKLMSEDISLLIKYPILFSELESRVKPFSLDLNHFINRIKLSEYSNEIINSLSEFDPYYSYLFKNNKNELSSCFLNSLLGSKLYDYIFLLQIKMDINSINYYIGSNSNIYKYYFEHCNTFDDEILDRCVINYDIFVMIKDKLRGLFIKKYDIEDDVDDLFECFEFIAKNNDELFRNFSFQLLKRDNIVILKNSQTKKINTELVRCLCRNKIISDNLNIFLSSLDVNKKIFFSNIITYIFNSNFNKNQLIYDFIYQLNEKKTYNILKIFDDVSTINDNTILDNLIYYILNTNSSLFVNIQSLDDLKNMEKKLEYKMINSNDEKNIELLREYVLFFNYRLSIINAKHLNERYGHKLTNFDFELTSDEESTINILKNIKKILECDIYDELYKMLEYDKVDKDPCFYYRFEEEIRIMFARRLNASLLDISSITKKEKYKNREVYFAFDENNAREFKILLTSLGAYSFSNIDSNYYNDWFRTKEKSHAFCSSLISNQMLGTAPINNCCLGFSSILNDSLLLAAPYDIYSRTDLDNIINEHHGRECQFLFPNDMINSTRRTYNELVIERTTDYGKIYPSYVVFFCQNFDKQKLLHKFNILWNNACKASDDLDIPIVVIETEKIMDYEISQVDVLRNSIMDISSYKDNMIFDYVTRLLNNCSSNRLGTYGINIINVVMRINEIINYIYEMIDKNLIEYANIYYNDLCRVIEREKTLKKNYTFENLKFIITPDMYLIRHKLLNVEKKGKKL